jgi:hypothetical protein
MTPISVAWSVCVSKGLVKVGCEKKKKSSRKSKQKETEMSDGVN